MTMTTKPRLAHTLLPGFMLACVALPGGTAAQSATPIKGPGTLGAAMAEALRGPFHATTDAGGLDIVQRPRIPFHTPETGPVQDSARGPSFHRVFWPTLVAAPLSHLALWFLIYAGCYHALDASCWAGSLAGGATAILVPATVSRIAGGSFAKGALGSAVGGGLGVGLYLLLSKAFLLDDETAYWALPVTQALFTARFSMR